ncbi:putative fungal specific transcription factor domain-containing protein [Rosellinia necatrix]|uniref:Putative fungal specific transcription factor domain-containing protein n=1 Tax=Rosellinia necatrix TaxID=77044 RepID=A0A1W2TDU3_ROSNE|nr:putative fungal specific transcription factor domain-containing protein [Rosellinia necatrix]
MITMNLADHVPKIRELGPTSRPSLHIKPIRRRNRVINSCLECRKRKLKCSKTEPTCTNCAKASRDCLYIGPRLDEVSQMRLAEIKEKQGTLERQLERDVAKSAIPNSTLQQHILADEVEDDDCDERDLEVTPLVALDLTYEDGADDGADDMIDLGIQIGKMRITERIGGLSRPRISEEILVGMTQRTGGHSPHTCGSQMLAFEGIPDGIPDSSLPDFLKPTSQHIAPTSGFFFGQIGASPDILQFLPYRTVADRLMTQYFRAVHPIAPCSHRPSAEGAYATFWDDITAGYEPRPSTQAIIFATMFSGLVSMNEETVFHELGGYTKANWVAHLKIGTETALSKANFLRTTRVETMQAFVIYMVPLCRAEVSRAHSVLVGAAVRMAECIGLHRDGDTYGLPPLETHVRRLVWHQLCFLDIRTCEAQGPKPVIRREDYDTKLPVNCNEEEFTATVGAPSPEPSKAWTTNTLSLIRFEINEMMRAIWVDRRRLENRRTTLTAVLTKIESFRRRMSEKYDPLLDVSLPPQRYAKCIMYLLTYRLHIMVLHPYYANASSPMPPRLTHLLITSGVMVIELAIQLETHPLFQDWAWYMGAYFQYQIAILLATEVYFRPQNREADRIWACLDYVFSLDRKLPPEAKSTYLLTEISSRTAVYMRKRRMRGPSSTARAAVAANAVAGTSPPSPIRSQHQARQQQQLHQHHQRHQQHQPQPTQILRQPQRQDMDTTNTGHIPPGAGTDGVPKPERSCMPPHIPPTPMTMPSKQQMVFAGVSDGQVVWNLPTNAGSPQSSDSSSGVAPVGGALATTPAAAVVSTSICAGGAGVASDSNTSQGNIMDNIDWDTMYSLFPNDAQTGELSAPGYHDTNFGEVGWGR